MKAFRLTAICALASAALYLLAAPQTNPQNNSTQAQPPQRETLARPLSEREKKKNEEKLRKELESPYRKWLTEDVAYIITQEERDAFKKLQTDDEREQFIEQFWLRRDPTPDTEENEFKEEHYRRIAYANEHFASGIPGWKTDRGRIYIMYGPPDDIDDHSSGGSYERPREEGGGETSTFPFQIWRYRYIPGVLNGTGITIEFVDTTMSGEFHMTMDPSEKDALLYTPDAGLTMYEEMGITQKTDRFTRTDGTHLGVPVDEMMDSQNEFTRLQQFTDLQKPPAVQFKDLEAVVDSKVSYSILPMKAKADFFPVTDASVMAYITLEFANKDLQFKSQDGMQRATVDIYGRITTMTRRRVQVFEDTVQADTPPEMLQEYTKQRQLYQKAVPLPPGTYRLDVVAKDLTAGTQTTYDAPLIVPRLDADKMSTSSLVLADLIEGVPRRSIGTGPFVIGDTKVRPRMDNAFTRGEKMGIYLKAYNFAPDEGTRKPDATVEYIVLKNGANDPIFDYTEDVAQMPDASTSQVTIEKLLPLKTLEPGKYTIKVKITDKVRNQVATPTAQFTIT
jgi:GWxTD domain-containing protein